MCCGRWLKLVRNLTVNRSRNPFTKRRTPYLDRPQRRGLAKVPAEADAADVRVGLGQFGDNLPGAVAAAVVHEDDFEVERPLAGDLADLGVQFREAVALVEDGDDDGDHAAHSLTT